MYTTNKMESNLYKALFGDKSLEDVLKNSSEKLSQVSHPNTLNYFEVEKGEGWSTTKHVYIPAEEGEGKPQYAKWVKYVKEAMWKERGSYILKKDTVMSYEQWMENKKKKNIFKVSFGVCSLILILFFIGV